MEQLESSWEGGRGEKGEGAHWTGLTQPSMMVLKARLEFLTEVPLCNDQYDYGYSNERDGCGDHEAVGFLSKCPSPSLWLKNLLPRHVGSWPMAGAQFWDAKTCPWTQGLYTSSLSSTPGTHGFQIGDVLLLDYLPTNLPKDVWLFRGSHFSLPQASRASEGRSQIWGQCTLPKPLGHKATRQFIGNLTYMYFCRRVACEHFGTYGTRSCLVHMVGFCGDPKFEANVHHLNPLATRPHGNL